ncbi:hypothetical protein L3Q82_012105 [Scortum barcoo]|uniref:Uncharacterized protein n=1 Tax=Scortum barcoo TaxID=214431 RepID=A0ACB8W754_9TELE|nr:hypothetical protein L3Q82_012105 [Scortum barcoo]
MFFLQVQKDHVTPIYVINLLISDLIQLCSMIIEVTRPTDWILYEVFNVIYLCGLTSSVGFMVFGRRLAPVVPLQTNHQELCGGLCGGLGLSLLLYFVDVFYYTVFAIFLLLPLPLFIFFLGGTLRALSASQSVPSDEKRRIVGCLVLVMLIYTLLFLPTHHFVPGT